MDQMVCGFIKLSQILFKKDDIQYVFNFFTELPTEEGEYFRF